jgi:glycosyltransferase involved in cell wall biosynthesis
MTAPQLSIVVPTFGGRDSLAPLLQRLRATLERRNIGDEVIIVNDTSPDDTWAVLGALAEEHPELHAIDLLNNHGQPMATVCGLHHARGELVASMDDDLQHSPEELPKLLDALEASVALSYVTALSLGIEFY